MMRVKEAFTRIFYFPLVSRCVHRLGLAGGIKKLYALARIDGQTLKLKLNGVEALLQVQTPSELCFVEGSVLFHEHYVLTRMQEMLKPGDVFLDVGSNLGIFTIFGAKAVGPTGTVIACEPATSAFDRLRSNTDLNRLNNVKLLKLALSDGCSTKHLCTGQDMNALGGRVTDVCDADSPSEDVRAVDYDSLVEDEGLPIPCVVKMDIEGHEYTALNGMKRTLSNAACAALFCEIHPYALPIGVSVKDVLRLIESVGFECVSTRIRGTEHHVTATKRATRSVIGRVVA